MVEPLDYLVVLTDSCADALLFQISDNRPRVGRWNQVNVPSLIYAKIKPDICTSTFQITICGLSPRGAPPLTIAGIVPDRSALFAGVIAAIGQWNSLTISSRM